MLLKYLDSQLILTALTRLGLNFPTGDLITAHANTLDRDKDKTALARSLFSQAELAGSEAAVPAVWNRFLDVWLQHWTVFELCPEVVFVDEEKLMSINKCSDISDENVTSVLAFQEIIADLIWLEAS